eukprot:TRINITY_DN41300_c0_g1_i3.p1 TRINITY_DN41300_c0_g1~~TRINITY_DN41300_c0_g1_i3.p1  ORF type:complete len:495 (-),score=89.35 TRINITY_DN41300_c0_g1_i3:73-1557(-)
MDWFRARADELRSKADELKARATHSLGAGQFQVADRSVIQGQLLADGGFAYVYAGSDAVTGDKLAIRKQNLQDEESTQKARIELNLLESLVDHPHVVRFCGGEIVSVAASGGTRAAARQSITLFELCTGGTLLKKLEGAVAARAPKTFEAGAQQVCCPCFNNSEAIDVLRAGAAVPLCPRAALEKNEVDVARRLHLSASNDNEQYGRQALEEARAAEDELAALRRQANLITAQCRGQLNVVQKEVRAEIEQRALSDQVAKELDALRAEIRCKEATEEERLGHLYRVLTNNEPRPAPLLPAAVVAPLAPALRVEKPAPAQAPAIQVSGLQGREFGYYHAPGSIPVHPPIIASATRLITSPVDHSRSQHKVRYEFQEELDLLEAAPEKQRRPRGGGHSAAARAAPAAAAAAGSFFNAGIAYKPSVDYAPIYEGAAAAAVLPKASGRPSLVQEPTYRRRDATSPTPSYSRPRGDGSEAHRLLDLNEERLKRLAKLGL